MKVNYLLFLFLLFQINTTFSQQMPIDFSGGSDTFSVFSGSSFALTSDPEDAGNPIGQFSNDGSDPWQGFYIDLSRPIDLGLQKTISLSYYGYDTGSHNILLKLENGANPNVEVTQNVSGSGWTHNIIFDFSNAVASSDGVTPVNATGQYSRLTIFIDGGSTVSGTYLIDSIDDGSTPTDPNVLDVTYTDLVWSDEFDTNGAVNSTNWFHQTQLPAGGSWYNNEVQHYTDRTDNSYVAGGFLNIVSKKETYSDQGYTKSYTSARLNSKFAFTYGRVDVRAKIPTQAGTWPAIWMLGKNINEDGGYWDNTYGTTNWPACGEIDIMEHGIFPSEDPNYISSALHTPCCYGGNPNKGGIIASDLVNDFHIYSMNWSPDQISFLLDGVVYYTYNPSVKDANTWPFDADQYILLNIAMGGVAGTIDPSFTEGTMQIDYVRVYQNSSLSIKETRKDAFKVFPNPVKTELNIKTSETIDDMALYDIFGKLVLKHKEIGRSINVENLPAGVYFLKIYSGPTTTIKKVLKY
ncbi:family 16 glycosylhydrolase [Gaetbulibacter sp. M240]|uniref:family 16 glycosylhydrolase n=1 Tax=Gaetbulibacter sp. M240 TaxID=3126511 RepID=UPI00374FC6E3